MNKEVTELYNDMLDAIERGDSDALSQLIKQAWEDMTVSINPQIQKACAKAIMDHAGFEAPLEVKTTTSKAAEDLQRLKDLFAAQDTLTPEAEQILNKHIEDATTHFTMSDGIQRSWQAFTLMCIKEHLENEGLNGAIIDDVASDIIKYGAKRPKRKSEKEVELEE